MTPEYLVINCLFWDGSSDYNNRIINLAKDYLDKTDEPTVTGFNNYIIHNNLKSASNLNGNLNCSKELEHYAS